MKKYLIAALAALALAAPASAATTDTAQATATPAVAHVGDTVTLSGIRCTVICTQDWTWLNGSRLGRHIGYGDSTGSIPFTVPAAALDPIQNNLAAFGVMKVQVALGEKCVGSPRLGCVSYAITYITVAP